MKDWKRAEAFRASVEEFPQSANVQLRWKLFVSKLSYRASSINDKVLLNELKSEEEIERKFTLFIGSKSSLKALLSCDDIEL